MKFFLKYKFIYFNWRLITLQYCIGFAIHQHVSATGIHVFPILNNPPSSLLVPSLWVIPMHQPQASSIMHQTWTGDSFHIFSFSLYIYFALMNSIAMNILLSALWWLNTEFSLGNSSPGPAREKFCGCRHLMA